MTNDILSSSISSNFAPANYRSAEAAFGGNYPISTPSGIVHTSQPNASPPLPPRPNMMYQSSQSYSPYGNSYGYGGLGGMGGYGGFGGMGGMGGYGGFNSYGGGYGGYRPGFGSNPLDPETRFIQMAEESSRSAFQSIEQVVSMIGNIATMFDSTYFALTSSFRAVLGLAANFSQMRGFLANFFSTFTIFRHVIYWYRKLLYKAGLSRTNPTIQINLNEAFKDAEKVNSNDFFNSSQRNSSGLPMVLFVAFIFSAPYLIMKLFGSLMNTAVDNTKNPSAWVNSVDAVVMYNFNGENQAELTLKAGQKIKIAPREIQQMNRLLSTNWLLATPDGKNVGLVPVNYIRRMDVNQVPLGETADLMMDPVIIKNDPPIIINNDQPTIVNDLPATVNIEPPVVAKEEVPTAFKLNVNDFPPLPIKEDSPVMIKEDSTATVKDESQC